ncbi:molybdenum abc periplasmic molybdate-binding protein : Extracellular solute-binding protein family 1 OS=Chthoniobacter flavus Ellin428 GN=CfE428DRAFT_1997 PE=4 SV=1: SBP_bac_11 [Gemmataceae bacterium]|nr:molybdenum abc periplasmic molybdate-binding protein : Extracellular solute-binding protein family 1 OS=Chthoniobacter flavus Ellin428 GN=CfE428DRAFT_1997 PE=4 SV=1: SBP_bac_11 [Gemmataceae bacterium]VTU01948.1 molybdenum abc periplasmic molybdate-binding protein : Extracellular solute-binding protein family 1 OS=Chthoniobacter flavus Ellin428 GN=CfE428DRAFT_1997 PE=4 SV=1: SBP_bac_11 [Gemmataceae bacterium]
MRLGPSTAVALGSAAALVILGAALAWRERDHRPGAGAAPPLIVYAAPTVRLALERAAADYERETGQSVELRFGASEDVLTRVRLPTPSEPADLFVPADDSYVRQAREQGFVAESFPVARVRAVLLLASGNTKKIETWADLLGADVRVAVPNPGAAVGMLARTHLKASGRWAALEPRVVDTGTVTEAANAAKAGGVDAAVVWDAVAHSPGYRGQAVLTVPELDGVEGRIEVATLLQSLRPAAARRFARYLSAADRGLAHFRELQFTVAEGAPPWAAE